MIDQTLLADITNQFTNTNDTIAVAESVTAGWLQHALASAEFAAQFFQGGITVYNIGQKVKHLKVEPIHAMSCNCVSEKVAEEMALQVNELFNSQWGIAITGYATVVPESNEALFAFYSIAYKDRVLVTDRLTSTASDPEKVKTEYVNSMLKCFLQLVQDRNQSNPDNSILSKSC